jgi:putative colanic acid biosynthesis acetyltransferase WcaF
MEHSAPPDTDADARHCDGAVVARAQTERVVSWPYTRREYVMRALWIIVHGTLWKLAWKRIPWLRSTILRLFGARFASSTAVMASSCWIELPWHLDFGRHVCLGPRVTLYNLGGVRIGDNSVLSQDVYVCGGTHDYTDSTYPLLRMKITIGHSVWIGAGAFISPGVEIGDGAVVGARAVVTKDVEPWTVVAGNPAKFLRKRELRVTESKATQ